jgi:hypothetical protein
MKWFSGVILLLGVALAAPASAQFYKYLDKQGHVRFTDDINQVPESQRDNARTYAAALPSVAAANDSDGGADQKPAGPDAASEDPAGAAVGASVEEESLDAAKARLEALKKQLDAEYLSLAREKEVLGKEKDVPKNRTQGLDYNKRVEVFNQKVGDYEKLTNELRQQVESFNTRVMEENSRIAASAKK